MRALALLMNEHLKKRTFHVFIFILPTSTLGLRFAHFLFTHKEINYISGTPAQFLLGIINLFSRGCKKNGKKLGVN